MHKFFPIIQWAGNYRREYFSGDVAAGLTVGIMLIPQGMAYAMIAGLPPVYGLYASLVPQVIYALLGTSRTLSVAPVAMDSLLVASGVSVLATEGTDAYIGFAILLAFFMGSFQFLLGIFRMGFITNLLARPVISGFTSAAALIIGLNQLKYLLGIELKKSNQIQDVVLSAIENIDKTHILTLVVGLGGILLIFGLKRLHKRIPGSLLAVVLGIVVVYQLRLFENGVSVVQDIPQGLPAFRLPQFSLGQFAELIPLALTISVVAFMESYSVSKALEAKKKDHKVNANQELVALGASNLIGSFFQTYPVTGGFSRSAVNHQSGAHTPLASVISALLIGLVLLFLTPLFYYLPEAILASVIMVAVTGLIDYKYTYKLWRENKTEFILLSVTFLVTATFSMVPGIITGVILSILILLYKAAYPHIAELGRIKNHSEFRNVRRFRDLELWADALIVRIDAPITFINIQNIRDYLVERVEKNKEINTVIIDASPVSHLDATGAEGLHDLANQFKDQGIILKFADVVGPVRDTMYRTGLMEKIGEDNFYLTLHDAVTKLKDNSPYDYKEKALQKGVISIEKPM